MIWLVNIPILLEVAARLEATAISLEGISCKADTVLGAEKIEMWPVLIFPFAIDQEDKVVEYIREHGFYVKKREKIIFKEVLQASLYGGQPWYESLRDIATEKNIFGKEAIILWVSKGEEAKCSIAAIARKLQLQLRPSMDSYSIKKETLLYPGVIKAFHTPHLGNVGIHTLILGLEEWKC